MPEDNQLAAERKQAQKRADKLQTDLLTSCNELTALTVIPDECFGDDFYDSISAFIETTKKNEKARNKVQEMKNRLSDRGITNKDRHQGSNEFKTSGL